MNKIVIFLGLLLVTTFTFPVFAQNTSQNLASIRVDDLSDDQIRAFVRQVEASGLGEAQLEQIAQARGMRPEEVKKLRERVDKLKGVSSKAAGAETKKGSTSNTLRSYTDDSSDEVDVPEKTPETEAEKALSELRSKLFGFDLFNNKNQTFEPNLNMATPKGYVIGPNDQLLVDLTGNSEASYDVRVNSEGNIKIEYVGIIPVSGLTVEAATSRIKSRMATIYSGLNTGNTRLNVAVGNIRSIKVILTGEVKTPGTYTLPSLATVFNALYSSGGPTENGSLRAIELIRSGKKVAVLDVYDFLMKGEMAANIRLQDQDIIRIPVYKSRVEILGEVKRPGIFELMPGDNFVDLLNYAGGFTENAYQARIKVLKNTDSEREIANLEKEQFNGYLPVSGDKYFVDRVLARFSNRVQIEGAVFRPGFYQLEPGMTLTQLVQKSDGLKEDAYLLRGYITRLKPDNQTQLISFDYSTILSGKMADIQLQREDVVTIPSIFDLKEDFKVSISGEVRKPGEFAYAENMTVEDLIVKSGGFLTSASPYRIEISRRVLQSDRPSATSKTSDIFLIDVDKKLTYSTSKFELRPFDMVTVRVSVGYEVQKQVNIEGEVLYPGSYTIANRNERISDLLERAGGVTDLAYIRGASLKRSTKRSGAEEETELKKKQKMNVLDSFGEGVVDSTSKVALQEENEYVGINLQEILANPKSSVDLILEEGDVLRIPKELQTVKLGGAVLYPVVASYYVGQGLGYYISQAGGFTDKASKKRTYVLYANGSVRTTSRLLFFNNYPPIEPGAEIVVPARQERKRISTSEIVGISSALASMAIIILNLVRL